MTQTRRGTLLGRRRATGSVLAACTGAVILLAPAAMADGGGVGGTVSVALRSVTVSTTTLDLNNCFPSTSSWSNIVTEDGLEGHGPSHALGFPNGVCTSPRLTITNGDVAGTILVEQGDGTPGSADAVGLDGTGSWAYDGSDAGDAVGFMGEAPADDAYVAATATATTNPAFPSVGYLSAATISDSPACDTNFDVTYHALHGTVLDGCVAAGGQANDEEIAILGPNLIRNNDTATTYGFVTTWIAAP